MIVGLIIYLSVYHFRLGGYSDWIKFREFSSGLYESDLMTDYI